MDELEKAVDDVVRIPGYEQVARATQAVRSLRELLSDAYVALKERMNEVATSDLELAHHELFIREVEDTLDELRKEAGRIKELNAVRFFRIVVGRGADGIIALGKKFKVDADLLPKTPTYGSTEHLEMLSWVGRSPYADKIKTDIPWMSMKAIINDLAEQGQPFPPNVDTYTKPKVSVR